MLGFDDLGMVKAATHGRYWSDIVGILIAYRYL
jgi:hypothetical protein